MLGVWVKGEEQGMHYSNKSLRGDECVHEVKAW